MIDETKYAFGLDGSRYWSTNGLANFRTLAAARNPTVRFLAFRATISWGYVDSFFEYHWKESKKVLEYRREILGMPDDFYLPVGRIAYGVIYPGEDPTRQAYHLLKTVEDQGADWTHDRLVLDNELHHNQSKSRITWAANTFGEVLRAETGRLPLHYMRHSWAVQHMNTNDLLDFPNWFAQYLYPIPFVKYRDEYQPPPTPIYADWTVHQTAERGDPRPYGVTGKDVIDYNRWNGGVHAVVKFFGHDNTPEPPPDSSLKGRIEDLEEDMKIVKEKLGI